MYNTSYITDKGTKTWRGSKLLPKVTQVLNTTAEVHPSNVLLEPVLWTTPPSCKHAETNPTYANNQTVEPCSPSSLRPSSPAAPGCGSTWKPLNGRKVRWISNSSSNSVGRFAIGWHHTAMRADVKWMHSRPFLAQGSKSEVCMLLAFFSRKHVKRTTMLRERNIE